MARQQRLHPLITRALCYAMRAGHRWLGLHKLYTEPPTATATEIMFHPPVVPVRFRNTKSPIIELTPPALHSHPSLRYGLRKNPEFE